MGKLRIFCGCVMLFLFQVAFAQNGINGWGNVKDFFTRQYIGDVKVVCESEDGSKRDTSITQFGTRAYNRDCIFYFPGLKEGKYRLVINHEDYEPVLKTFDVKSNKARVFFFGDIYLKRKPKEHILGSATVTATKVKLYTKGDTLVFNADAFQLAEGSMLDGLIRQLPGAELKDDGRILVNGKQIESLLLNGDDFFKGNNKIMLDNLPSYMVHQVKVYEKEGELSKFTKRNMGDKSLVMDVRLKKQYSIGWIGNAEAGYGSRERYLGRLFALRFTPQSRISFFGNVNNLNDDRQPGENTEWTPNQMPDGLTATKWGGLDYKVKDRYEHFEISGNAALKYIGLNSYNRVARENYLPQGNTWQHSETVQKNSNFSFSTSHVFNRYVLNELDFQKAEYSLSPSFSYSRWDKKYDGASATFSDNPLVKYHEGLFDTIRQIGIGDMLRRYALNRYLNESKTKGHNVNTSLSFSTYQNLCDNQFLAVSLSGGYRTEVNEEFAHKRYDYPSDLLGSTDYHNEWNKEKPNKSVTGKGGITYIYFTPFNMSIRPSYSFGYSHSDHDYMRNRLERLAGWDENSNYDLGILPSELNFELQTLDKQNSFKQGLTTMNHEVGASLVWEGYDKSKIRYWDTQLSLFGNFTQNTMDYVRGEYDGKTHRNFFMLVPNLFVRTRWHGMQRGMEWKYTVGKSAPDMVNLLDIERSSNPLQIYRGNPGLKNTTTHTLSWNYWNNSQRKLRNFNAMLNYNVRTNAIAMSYIYDRSSGVRTYCPQNVNGNYVISGNVNYNMPLDRKRYLNFSTATNGQYGHNVDLLSTTASNPVRTTSKIIWLRETLNMDYRINRVKIGVKGMLNWNNARSHREDFATVNIYDFQYGPTLKVDLPLHFQVSTDITMYCRRGYNASSSNTNDLVWNARLSKMIPKANLTFAIDGFDILGNLSNMTHYLDANGMVETYRNVIPRYVMAHIVYRLNIKPKKRAGEA